MTTTRHADGPAVVKAMLGEARAEIVWVRCEAPDEFWDDPEVTRCVDLIADAAAELRGRYAKHLARQDKEPA